MKTLKLGILAASALLFITASAPALDLQLLYALQGAPIPCSALVFGRDGNLYGTTDWGGSNDGGTVFKVTTNGVFTSLVSFTSNPTYPSGLVLVPDGSFYGTTYRGGSYDAGTVFRVTTNGVLTTLVSFNTTNGEYPTGLVLGNDGNFYGTTENGGSSGVGTVFKVTKNGVLTSLVSFNTSNGTYPNAGLTLGPDGNFYGTTSYGGSNGGGTVFKVTTNGVLTRLVSFNNTSGASPFACLVLGPDGNFYGTTYYGGSSGVGTVFKATTNGMLTPLVSFSPPMGGSTARDGLLFGRDGNLYGTSWEGGSYGAGTVFQVTTKGVLSTLVSFNTTIGTYPGHLMLGPDGSFYGITSQGGPGGGGTIFRLSVFPPQDITPPSLVITSHADLQVVNTNKVTLAGTASDAGRGGSGITNVTVNALRATNATAVGESTANWSCLLSLNPGTNKITVVARDGAGNSATNFIRIISDTVRPTFTITAPTANQRWSNAVFTVRGTATDNVQVSNVWCQANNGVWGAATLGSGRTNWTIDVALVWGTNTVWAYAEDAAGNGSLTNSVNFVYVVTDRLSVVATGKGTISPNYSNAWLEIGRQYSMTAKASSGYAFTNWVISTNWVGGVATNNATVQFMMQSNLTLQVNFADVTRPTNAITSPKPGQKVNAVMTATGTASDNAQVAAVKYQLNSNAWAVATGTTSWSAAMSLLKGTNVLRAYAVDASGNTSTTNIVTFVCTNDFQMNLSLGSDQPLTGTGLDLYLQVTPGLNGRIESSTDLVFWTTLTNFVGTNVPVQFRDSAAPNYNRRFYRAVSP